VGQAVADALSETLAALDRIRGSPDGISTVEM
jgi:hypothetical protein